MLRAGKKGNITIVGLEPHPEDKASRYRKVTLSAMGKETNCWDQMTLFQENDAPKNRTVSEVNSK